MIEIGAWEKDALVKACKVVDDKGIAGVWLKPPRGIAGDYIKKAGRFTDANTTFHEIAFYTVVGAYFGRKLSFLAGARPTYANLYALIIGPSSIARKSTVLDLAALLAKRLEVHVVPASITPEQLHDHLAVNPKALYMAFEVARFFALARRSYGAGIVEFLLEIYDSPDVVVRETVSKGRVEIHDVHFSFLGGGVPAQVRAAMGAVDVTGGLAPRFLWVLHQVSPLQDFIGAADMKALDVIAARLAQARAVWPGEPITWTVAAEADLAYWQGWLLKYLAQELGDPGASFAARYGIITMKIAAIHAALTGSRVMEARHVRDAAFAVLKTLRTVSDLGKMLRTDAKTSVLTLRIISHVRTAGTITRENLLGKMVPTVTSGSLTTILKTLIDADLIEESYEKITDDEGAPARGHPRTYYRWKGKDV